MAFSPDGTKIATASWDKTARLWDAATGKPLGAPMKHDGIVLAVAFSPDGTKIATASATRRPGSGTRRRANRLAQPMKHDGAVTGRGLQPGRHEDRHRQRGQDGPAVGRGDGQTVGRAAEA